MENMLNGEIRTKSVYISVNKNIVGFLSGIFSPDRDDF